MKNNKKSCDEGKNPCTETILNKVNENKRGSKYSIKAIHTLTLIPKLAHIRNEKTFPFCFFLNLSGKPTIKRRRRRKRKSLKQTDGTRVHYKRKRSSAENRKIWKQQKWFEGAATPPACLRSCRSRNLCICGKKSSSGKDKLIPRLLFETWCIALFFSLRCVRRSLRLTAQNHAHMKWRKIMHTENEMEKRRKGALSLVYWLCMITRNSKIS